MPSLAEYSSFSVEKLRVEHHREQLEGMQATHQTKMDQMSSRVKQLGSCQVEQLSVFVGAVIQDVQMFRQARQKVDSLEDHLKINEKETNVRIWDWVGEMDGGMNEEIVEDALLGLIRP